MSTVSKEILDKLRQLSDLLIVIKESGNNTPQILKELAVEKCSEIYSVLSKGTNIVEYKIEETSKEEEVEEENIAIEDEEKVDEEIKPCNDTETFISNVEGNGEELPQEDIYTPETKTEEDRYSFIEESIKGEPIKEEIIITPAFEEECKPVCDTNEIELEESLYEDESFEEEAEDEKMIDINIEVDLFSSKDEFKKCNHKKIRTLLSINDIFLYKRELFGNSDVDMTDMFDGIDEAESFDDAMELISEYFGDDINKEEMVIEFIERVKQCFE
ncbi:MAG: hypothetical protein IKU59_07420 [Bacteroidales bacterium]|nr:hypothetical protein [Bacteroidales bacterium]